MLWYVAIVAVLNLCLGYLWGAYVRPCPRCAKARAMGLSLLAPTAPADSEFRIAANVEQRTASVVPEPQRGALESDEVSAFADEESSPRQPAKPPIPLDSATGLVTREYAELMLTQMTAADSGESPVAVALVEIAPIDWIGEQPNAAIDKRLLSGVSNIVRQSLADDHTMARFSDQQFLLLVPHEDVQQATRRAEELRQRVATTEFVADGRTFQTTVTCALAEASDQRTGTKLFEFLREALDEAKRYGGNRTFMHDGNSPTPVMPAELTVSPQQLAI